MRRGLTIIGAILSLVVAGAAAFVATYQPRSRPPLDVTVEITPERVARGEYLANVALSCMACHAQRDWGTWGGPILGPVGAGGESWVREHEFPGRIFAPNLTPDPETGLGVWTDGEILRAIREGIGREGQALFNLMPFAEYSILSDEDAYAVVAYLRSLPPVRRGYPEREIDFPVSFLMKLAPRPLEGPVPEPDRDDPVAYGRYLTTVGGCRVCHTPVDWRHLPMESELFAGGQEFIGNWGRSVSANLTSDPEGLGNYTRENFVDLFRSFQNGIPDEPARPGSIMPWRTLCQLEDRDLEAIYAYLQTVPARPDHAP